MDWFETNSFLRGVWNKLDDLKDPVRIAGFDLDDTLIHRPKSNNPNLKWKLLDSDICLKILELVNDGYAIIVFSNQSGMGTGKTINPQKWRLAMYDLAKILMSKVKKFYFAVYVAKTYDLYRKPNIGLWHQMKIDLIDEFNLDTIRISKKSFYCGDAGGRTNPSIFRKKLYPSSKKGDFSDTDRKFALNIGIEYFTPEEFYLKDPPVNEPFKLHGLNPKKYIESIQPSNYEFNPRSREMIVLVGAPGSGKTDFYKKYIESFDYVHINQDKCKTKKKCIDSTIAALEDKKSVVIDNTNPDVISRMNYTSLAKKYGYKHIRCIVLNTDIDIAMHLNNVRHVYSGGKIPKISNIVYNIYKKKFCTTTKNGTF